MEKWAFATSLPPHGLGLSSVEFWYLSHEEYDAKVFCWEKHHKAQFIMLANLRADLHNGQMEKRDKSPWTAQDFGAPTVKQKAYRKLFRPSEILPQIRATFAGKMRRPDGQKLSIVKNLKGQPLKRKA
jgi:hypothetical protein